MYRRLHRKDVVDLKELFADAQVARLSSQIDDLVEERRNHYINFLSGLLRFKTISGARTDREENEFKEEISKCLTYLEVESDRLGMTFRNYDDLAAVAELGVGPESTGSVGVAAHIDVVPVTDGWTHPPFSGTVTDGAIWGRGAQDDKGPIAAVFAALDALTSLELEPLKDIRVLIGTLEETDDWPDVDLLREKGEIPDVTIVPDGIFPIVNAEKGMAMVEWRASWEVVSRSDSEIEFIGLQSGERHNMVPAWATLKFRAPDFQRESVAQMLADKIIELRDTTSAHEAELRYEADAGLPGWTLLNIRFKGESAHSAFPENGHSAALDALAFLDMIDDVNPGLQHFAHELRARASRLDGSGFGISHHDEYSGDTTINLGVIEFGSGAGKAIFNIRFPTGVDSPKVRESFATAAKEIVDDSERRLSIDSRLRGRVQEPLYVSPDEFPEFLYTLQLAYETTTGRPPNLKALSGTTYSKGFPNAVSFGPRDVQAGDPELAHEIDERVTIERYIENIKVYALALSLLTLRIR